MFGLIDTPAEITDKAGASSLTVTGGGVAFEDVCFSYERDRPILNGVSFAIAPGKTLAVVGPSGADAHPDAHPDRSWGYAYARPQCVHEQAGKPGVRTRQDGLEHQFGQGL